jgi:hypothetical protein
MQVVTLVFDPAMNDPNRVAQRHVSRELGKGLTADEVIRQAWQHRHDFVPQAITSRTWMASPPLVPEISYEPAIVGGASEEEVMDALTKAGQR